MDRDQKERRLAWLLKTRSKIKVMRKVELASLKNWSQEGKNAPKVAPVRGERTYEPDDSLNRKIILWRGDITKLAIDAIVNAANSTLLGGGGVDRAIHLAAGEELYNECYLLNGCKVGDAKITKGYKLPAKHVIHTVGPADRKESDLISCYTKSLNLLKPNNLRSIAFCCISTGIFEYPNEDAAKVALSTTREWLEENRELVDSVIFCVFLEKDEEIYRSLLPRYFPIPEGDVIPSLTRSGVSGLMGDISGYNTATESSSSSSTSNESTPTRRGGYNTAATVSSSSSSTSNETTPTRRGGYNNATESSSTPNEPPPRRDYNSSSTEISSTSNETPKRRGDK